MLTNNTQSEFCIYAQDSRYTRRIDLILSQMFDGQSRSYIQRLIEDGLVMKNGVVLDRHCKVRRGDLIAVNWKIDKSHIAAEDIPLEVIVETNDYALVSKEAGMNVHPVPGEGGKSGTLINALMSHFGSLSVINGVERPGLVHRLDKDTSGILIIAKNDWFMTYVQRQINNRTVKKTYIALVAGRVGETKWYIESYMWRDPNDRKKHTINDPLNPKLAQTRYKVLGYFGDLASLVEVDLLTGRTHQIRLHMLSIGHPVVGDSVYGNAKINTLFADKYDLHRQALHAYRVEFTYESERVFGIAPLKEDIHNVIVELMNICEPKEASNYFHIEKYAQI